MRWFLFATGKQKTSVGFAIGTPGPELEQTVLGRLRFYALDRPQDPLVAWREHSAAGFEDHPVDCAHCWELANPALEDFLARDRLKACLPPKMREALFRRTVPAHRSARGRLAAALGMGRLRGCPGCPAGQGAEGLTSADRRRGGRRHGSRPGRRPGRRRPRDSIYL